MKNHLAIAGGKGGDGGDAGNYVLYFMSVFSLVN